MSPAEDYVIFEFPSLPENVAFARTVTAVFASRLDFTLDEIDDIRTCVSEAVTNVIVHAYQGRSGIGPDDGFPSKTDGSSSSSRTRAKASPTSSGPNNPLIRPRPKNTPGLGLYFISEFMEELEIDTRVGVGTRIRMAKRPSQAKQQKAAASHSH